MKDLKVLKDFEVVLYGKKDHNWKQFFGTIRDFLFFFQQNISISPYSLDIIRNGERTSQKNENIDYNIITTKDNIDTIFELQTPNKEYEMRVSLHEKFCYIAIFFQAPYFLKIMPSKQILSFFKQGICQLKATSYGFCHDSNYLTHLLDNIYGDFNFNGRDSSFQGFRWLLYLSDEEVAKNGGEALLKIPHLTHVERLPEGVLFQVGDSPLDALTPSGEEQLYLATKAWCDIVGCSKPLFRLP